MRLKYAAPLLAVVFLLFAGCMSSDPLLFSSTLPDGGKLYYLPVTPWKAGGDLGLAEIRLDITCRTSGDQQGTVNISFFGKKDMPGEIAALVLGGDAFEYPLNDAKLLLERPEQLELRLTASIPADALKRISPGEARRRRKNFCVSSEMKISLTSARILYRVPMGMKPCPVL
jgi:hypothetical protein